MNIVKFNSLQLKEFINSDEFKKLKFLPITKHRALSHINNPRSEPQDSILYVAYEGREVIGYRLILADNFFVNKKPEKMGWFSCVWVDPNQRGKGIAKLLVNMALKDWGNRIILVDPVKESKALYLQTGKFSDHLVREGIRGYLRFNLSDLLLVKGRVFKKTNWLIKMVDAFLNFFNNFRLFFWKLKLNFNDNRVELINEVDEETKAFIEDNNINELLQRGADELNWINRFPWILSTPIKDNQSSKYHFSSLSSSFNNYLVKIYDEKDALVAFIFLCKNNKSLKMPYCYFLTGRVPLVVDVIFKIIIKTDVAIFTTFKKEVMEEINSRSSPFIFTKNVKRQYLVSKEILKLKDRELNWEIQDGDGDAAFT